MREAAPGILPSAAPVYGPAQLLARCAGSPSPSAMAVLLPTQFTIASEVRSYSNSLILAAQIKSFSDNPSIAWVVKFTSQ